MMHFDFSANDQATAPFTDITLTHREWRHLRYLQKGSLHAADNVALTRYGLARENMETRVLGGMPVSTGRIEITDRGRSYLRYRGKELRRFWIPVGISALSFVVSLIALIKSV